MKKLLLLLDTDPIPNVYDIFVGYDGGADQVVSYGGIAPGNVGVLIDGAIFTRGPDQKKRTAIFIGGANMTAGEELLTAVTKHFFGNFRVSMMLDSNGSNTTAAATVAQIGKIVPLAGKKAVVLAGTGPVGAACCRAFRQGRSASKPDVPRQEACSSRVPIDPGTKTDEFGAICTTPGNLCLYRTAWWSWEDSNLQPRVIVKRWRSTATANPSQSPPQIGPRRNICRGNCRAAILGIS
jgi:Methylene-tetrahydromethanopterin dehydrogenase, N-terminal